MTSLFQSGFSIILWNTLVLNRRTLDSICKQYWSFQSKSRCERNGKTHVYFIWDPKHTLLLLVLMFMLLNISFSLPPYLVTTSILSLDQEILCLAEIQSKNDQKEENGENSCEGHLQTDKCQKGESWEWFKSLVSSITQIRLLSASSEDRQWNLGLFQMGL